MMMSDAQLRSDFLEGMARFASGVTAIASLDHDVATGDTQPVGLIATAVSSLSADPATLLICINKTASAHDPILRTKRFSVNVLGSDHQHVADRFAASKGADRFVADQWTTLTTGVPVLRRAAAAFDCEILNIHDGYSHSIIVGAVKAVAIDDTAAPDCLLWHRRHFATSAFA